MVCLFLLDVLKCDEMNKIRYGIKNLAGHIDVGQLYDASTDTRIPGTSFENAQRWIGQNTFPILLLNDDNMIGEH